MEAKTRQDHEAKRSDRDALGVEIRQLAQSLHRRKKRKKETEAGDDEGEVKGKAPIGRGSGGSSGDDNDKGQQLNDVEERQKGRRARARIAASQSRAVKIKKKDKIFKCPTCSMIFEGPGNNAKFKAHVRTHNDDRPYKCTEAYCRKAFKQASQCGSHMMHRHGGLKNLTRLPCICCGATFGTKQSLEQHFRAYHRVEIPWECEACGKVWLPIFPFHVAYMPSGSTNDSSSARLVRPMTTAERLDWQCKSKQEQQRRLGYQLRLSENKDLYERGRKAFEQRHGLASDVGKEKKKKTGSAARNNKAASRSKPSSEALRLVRMYEKWTQLSMREQSLITEFTLYSCLQCGKIFGSLERFTDHLRRKPNGNTNSKHVDKKKIQDKPTTKKVKESDPTLVMEKANCAMMYSIEKAVTYYQTWERYWNEYYTPRPPQDHHYYPTHMGTGLADSYIQTGNGLQLIHAPTLYVPSSSSEALSAVPTGRATPSLPTLPVAAFSSMPASRVGVNGSRVPNDESERQARLDSVIKQLACTM